MPQLSREHPEAVFSRLSVNDLFILRDLLLRAQGESVTDVRKRLGIGKRKMDKLKAALAGYTLGAGASEARLFGKNQAILQPLRKNLPALLEKLKDIAGECRKAQENRVVVQGSEFCVLWILPKVLAASGYLDKNPGVALDIKRAYFKRFMTHLQDGRTDLALGPEVPMPIAVERRLVLTVPRALIYPEGHRFACGKPPEDVGLRDLAGETVFVLTSAGVPAFPMEKYLARPKGGGRHVYVDSISHMYRYVSEKLGVAVGYAPSFAPIETRPPVQAVLLDKSEVPPAEFYLYFPKNRALSPPAAALKSAIQCIMAGFS
jgi:DNA-binding transcriptional LysR family regulator